MSHFHVACGGSHTCVASARCMKNPRGGKYTSPRHDGTPTYFLVRRQWQQTSRWNNHSVRQRHLIESARAARGSLKAQRAEGRHHHLPATRFKMSNQCGSKKLERGSFVTPSTTHDTVPHDRACRVRARSAHLPSSRWILR